MIYFKHEKITCSGLFVGTKRHISKNEHDTMEESFNEHFHYIYTSLDNEIEPTIFLLIQHASLIKG